MIFEKIRAIAASQLGKDESEISMDTNFRDELGADSLDLFQIISDIEDEFGIKIDEVENAQTLGDVVTIVENLTK